MIPAYNASKTIHDTLISIHSQTYVQKNPDSIDIVIMDDGSTDDTASKALTCIDPAFRTCDLPHVEQNKENKKRGYCRNWLLDFAHEWVKNEGNNKYAVWCDADDIMHPEKIAKQVEFMENNPEVGFCCTNYRSVNSSKIDDLIKEYDNDVLFNEAGNEGGCQTLVHKVNALSYEELIDVNPISGCTVMMCLSLVPKHIRYDESEQADGIEDWGYWKRLYYHRHVFAPDAPLPVDPKRVVCISDEPLYIYRIRDKSSFPAPEPVKLFRFDDISTNTDLEECNAIARFLKEKYPSCRVLYAVSPLVFHLDHEPTKEAKERVFPREFGALSDVRNFFCVNKVGFLGREHYPEFVEMCNHGLIHADHRLLNKQAQEISIMGGAALTQSKVFIPPFNKYNEDTESICSDNNLVLVKFSDGWRSFEHEPYDDTHSLWYLHPRHWTAEKLEIYMSKSIHIQ